MANSPLLITYGIDPEFDLLYSKWSDSFSSEQYREGLLHLAEVMQHNKIKLWLHDSLHLDEIEMQDQKWSTEVFAFLLAQSSLKHIAIVRPNKPKPVSVIKMLREKSYRVFGKIIGIEFFDTTEEAKAWLVPRRHYYNLPILKSASSLNNSLNK
jgi:hypothetical protein